MEGGNAGLFGIHGAGDGGAGYETDGTAVAAEVLLSSISVNEQYLGPGEPNTSHINGIL